MVTRGAAAQGAFQVLSHVASKSLEEVLAAAQKGQKIGWQLYMNSDRYVCPRNERAFEALPFKLTQ